MRLASLAAMVDEGAHLIRVKSQAARCSELFHEHGDLIALDGNVCHGREQIASYYDRQLHGPYRDLHVRDMEFEPVRFLASNLAVMNAEWKVVGFRKADGSEREPTLARITFVWSKALVGGATRRHGSWCRLRRD